MKIAKVTSNNRNYQKKFILAAVKPPLKNQFSNHKKPFTVDAHKETELSNKI